MATTRGNGSACRRCSTWASTTPAGFTSTTAAPFEVVSRASGGRISAFAVFVTDGPAVAIKMTAHLVCGDREHEKPGVFTSDPDAGTLHFRPAADTLFAGAYPDAAFDLTFDEPDQVKSLGQLGDLPWATATTTTATQIRFSIGGTLTERRP